MEDGCRTIDADVGEDRDGDDDGGGYGDEIVAKKALVLEGKVGERELVA